MTLRYVPAAEVRPDEPRFWCTDDTERDDERLADIRRGDLRLSTIIPAAMLERITRRPITRAVVDRDVPELPPAFELGGEGG